jgi:hypothetical protein
MTRIWATNGGAVLILALGFAGCEGKQRESAAGRGPDTLGAAGTSASTPGANSTDASPSASAADAPSSTEEGRAAGGPLLSTRAQSGSESDGNGAPTSGDAGSSGCSEGATQACGPNVELGVCKFGSQTCKDGAWGECTGAMLAKARDCGSADDNDCDGQPDNVADDVCRCPAGAQQACDEHAGLDGHGQCKAGSQRCVLGDSNLTSDWGPCTGSVGPGTTDSCTVPGDDTNCDNVPNGGCTCVEGQTMPCGPVQAVGICKPGLSTCTNGKFSACVGAVFPAKRDCTSSQDNDCDGKPDNTIDQTCTCAVGAVQPCNQHPGKDGNGACTSGRQTCQGGVNNASSNFTACSGGVGPAQRDSCSQVNDDSDCDGIKNGGCQCVAGNRMACADDPNNSRCTPQGSCAPCQVDADCSLVSGGRNSCAQGVCIQARGGDGIVSSGETCDTGPVPAMANIVPDHTCNSTCTAVYRQKTIRLTNRFDIQGNFGGPLNADQVCQTDLGSNGTVWKALIVGGGRQATATGNVGDQQRDWVLHPFTVYVNDAKSMIWATDSLPLLRVDSTGTTGPLLAPLFTSVSQTTSNYPWGGFDSDWTTLPDNLTCAGWAINDKNAATDSGEIILPNFSSFGLGESCAGSTGYLICVQQ